MRHVPSPRRRHPGFTLIELLVVIAIIAILIALLVPAVQKVREAAARTQCANNLKQMALALHAYHDVNLKFPSGGLGPAGAATAGGPSWLVMILPYIEQSAGYNSFDFTSGFDTRGTYTAKQQAILPVLQVKIYNCPSSDLPKYTGDPCNGLVIQRPNYVGISGAVYSPADGTTLLGVNSGYGWYMRTGLLHSGNGNDFKRMADITDGTSNVIVIGEQGRKLSDNTTDNRSCLWCGGAWEGCYYMNATSGAIAASQFCQNLTNMAYAINNMATGLTWANTPYHSSNPLSSLHTGGCQAARGDGSVAFLQESMPLVTLMRLSAINDGQVVGDY